MREAGGKSSEFAEAEVRRGVALEKARLVPAVRRDQVVVEIISHGAHPALVLVIFCWTSEQSICRTVRCALCKVKSAEPAIVGSSHSVAAAVALGKHHRRAGPLGLADLTAFGFAGMAARRIG